MKSDIIKVTSSGEGTEDALAAALASAAYRGLSHKDALHLRLLAEEVLGMVRQITGETETEFWVESANNAFEIHLVAHPLVTGSMRKELLKASSSGKNEASRGVMGKLRDIFDRALFSRDMDGLPDDYAQGLMMPVDLYTSDPTTYAVAADVLAWSMKKYKAAIENEAAQDDSAKEKWDELEKSIIVNIADEVKIFIAGNTVEMTVYKKFEN